MACSEEHYKRQLPPLIEHEIRYAKDNIDHLREGFDETMEIMQGKMENYSVEQREKYLEALLDFNDRIDLIYNDMRMEFYVT